MLERNLSCQIELWESHKVNIVRNDFSIISSETHWADSIRFPVLTGVLRAFGGSCVHLRKG